MDTALKQRLLGAIVLIALAIIFVPMFFSNSGTRQESETVSLEIPAPPDREFQTRIMPANNVTSATTTAPIPAPQSEPIVTVDAQTAPPPEAPPVQSSAEPIPSADTDAVASTAVTPAQNSAAGIAADARFYVHLGIYAASKNADDLINTLKQNGFAAFADNVEFQGKNAQRVRVGPYTSRAAAESARLSMKTLKPSVPSSVIELADDAKADASASQLAPNRAGGWAVQLGAFKAEDEANKLRDRLRTEGFSAFIDKMDTQPPLWRVRVGPEVDHSNAENLRNRIREKFKLDGMIVTQP